MIYPLSPMKKRRRASNGRQSLGNTTTGVYPNIRGGGLGGALPAYPSAGLIGQWAGQSFNDTDIEASDASSSSVAHAHASGSVPRLSSSQCCPR